MSLWFYFFVFCGLVDGDDEILKLLMNLVRVRWEDALNFDCVDVVSD